MKMGTYRHKLSFCVDHENLDLSVIPEQLNLPTNRLWKAGQPRMVPNGRLLGGSYEKSYCSIPFEHTPEVSLPVSLKVALAKLMPHKPFLEELVASGANLRFFVGWFSNSNSRDCLDWRLLREIADMKISLDLDFYGPDETNPVDQPQ
jgi:hypothetical protein